MAQFTSRSALSLGIKLYHHSRAKAANAKGRERCANLFLTSAWKCSEGHVWRAVLYSRTGPDKCGCPVCAGKVKKSKLLHYDRILAERR